MCSPSGMEKIEKWKPGGEAKTGLGSLLPNCVSGYCRFCLAVSPLQEATRRAPVTIASPFSGLSGIPTILSVISVSGCPPCGIPSHAVRRAPLKILPRFRHEHVVFFPCSNPRDHLQRPIRFPCCHAPALHCVSLGPRGHTPRRIGPWLRQSPFSLEMDLLGFLTPFCRLNAAQSEALRGHVREAARHALHSKESTRLGEFLPACPQISQNSARSLQRISSRGMQSQGAPIAAARRSRSATITTLRRGFGHFAVIV